MNTLSGPMIETRRVVVPGTKTYVEIRSEFHAESAWFGYIIETGDVTFGHHGSWGRHNIREAEECFAAAIEYAALHHQESAPEPTPAAPAAPKTLFDYVLTDAENNELYRRMRRAYNKTYKLWLYQQSRGCYNNQDLDAMCAVFVGIMDDLNDSHVPV